MNSTIDATKGITLELDYEEMTRQLQLALHGLAYYEKNGGEKYWPKDIKFAKELIDALSLKNMKIGSEIPLKKDAS